MPDTSARSGRVQTRDEWFAEIERVRHEHNAAVANGQIMRARALGRTHDALLRNVPPAPCERCGGTEPDVTRDCYCARSSGEPS